MLANMLPKAVRGSVPKAASRQFSSNSALSSLMGYPKTSVSTLGNGLRVASEPGIEANSTTATVGVWIDTGSRYETPANNGVAHFLEHMSFKGTPSRTRVQLEQEVENMGGHLNAYTSREQTVFYAKVNKEHVPDAVELLADILQNSTMSEDAIERERDVIVREMAEIDSQMEEVIFDRLHQTAYRDTMLGRTILGPEENIRSITKKDIEEYVNTHYVAPRMVVAGSGAVSHDQLVELSDKHFGTVPAKGNAAPVMEPAKFTGSDIRVRYDDMPQAHISFAFETAGWCDPDNYPLMVIANMLGSWSSETTGGEHSSSPLVAAVASQGQVASISTFNTQYSDTGLFGVYGVLNDGPGANQLMYEITNAMTGMCYAVDDVLLNEAKNQLKMNVLSQLDGSTAVCEDVGRQLLTYGRRIHPTETLARIDAVDANAVKNCANRYFYDRDFAMAAIGPILEVPDYNWLRRKTYWLRY